jgi:hypothetical protein
MFAFSIFKIEHKIYASLKSFPPTIVKWFMYVIFLMNVILDEVKLLLTLFLLATFHQKMKLKK